MTTEDQHDNATARIHDILLTAADISLNVPTAAPKLRGEIAAAFEELLHQLAPIAGRLGSKRERESAQTRAQIDELSLKVARLLADL